LALLCLALVWQVGANDRAKISDKVAQSATQRDRTRAALHAAMEKNVSYCRDWLAAGDWKSLRQTAEGLGIVVAVLAAQGDGDDWRKAMRGMTADVDALRSAAEDEDAKRSKQLLDRLEGAGKEAAKLTPKPAKKTAPDKRKPPAVDSLRPLMALMDGTHADAKAAVAVGDVDEAKNMALVLSELGRVVSNHRGEAAWRAAADALVRAPAETGNDPASDAKTIRQQLRGVYQRCEACHEKQR